MSRKSVNKSLLLSVINTDNTFSFVEVGGGQNVWVGKCLHCNGHLTIAEDGTYISKASLDHIVPKVAGGTDDVLNLGVACFRCNNMKGILHDQNYKKSAKVQEMVKKLLEKRKERWREQWVPLPQS